MNSEISTRTRAVNLGQHKYIVALVCGAAVLLAFIAIWRYAANAARERVWRVNQEVVAHAIETYRSTYGDFPPASVLDGNGQPMHSWRVLLVPYLQSNWFYDRYDLAEPWNGPHNQPLLKAFIAQSDDVEPFDITDVRWCYQHPGYTSYEGDFRTNLVMVIDPNRAPTRNTGSNRGWQARPHVGDDLMIVGIIGCDIHWMEPRDMSAKELISLNRNPGGSSKSSPHVTDSFIVKVDGTVQFLNEQETMERLRKLEEQ